MTLHKKFRVLFLSAGYAGRAQMAEGWAQNLANGFLEVRSACIETHELNPHAIEVMHEAGIDIAGQAPRRLTPELLDWANLVVTVCNRTDQHCPVVHAEQLRQHWALVDPTSATGSETVILGSFRACRDEIRERVYGLLQFIQPDPIRLAG